MLTPIFKICASDSKVTALLGNNPTRLFPFDEAPQNVTTPYAVYQMISGVPYNTLTTPCGDRISVQVDVYARSQSECNSITTAIRLAIQNSSYVTGLNYNGRDETTKLWRMSFDSDWNVDWPET